MTSHAIIKYIGVSRRKIARLSGEFKNKNINLVKARLSFMPQKSARELYQVIKSAESNFQFKNPNYNTDDLRIESILVDVGPTVKRMRPRAKGSADLVKKRSCHVKVVLTD